MGSFDPTSRHVTSPSSLTERTPDAGRTKVDIVEPVRAEEYEF